MSGCNQCGGPMGVTPSAFPGWNLLACQNCGRPIKLLPVAGPRIGSTKRQSKAELNRALRAARRMKLKGAG